MTNDPSVAELRRRSEQTRSELTRTVGDLRDKVSDTTTELKARISPENIKQEVRGYVRESRENLVDSFERKVRENPLQAVAVGAAVAYPLFGLLRAIPAPILLVGAGLWFAGKGGKRTVEQAKTKVADVVDTARGRVSDIADAAQEKVGLAASRVADAAKEAGASVSARTSSLADKTRAAVHDARDAVQGISDSVTGSAGKVAQGAASNVSDTAASIQDKASEAVDRSRNAFVDMVDRNPLLVAGVGLAVGAFIAASLPPSETENNLFGAQSDDLKDGARGLAAIAQPV